MHVFKHTIFIAILLQSCGKPQPHKTNTGVEVKDYYVNKDCAIYDTVNHIAYAILIPNSFSPNGDKVNDVFFPRLSGARKYEIQIFNSSDEKIFVTEEGDWNGNRNIEPHGGCKEGIYKYTMKVFEECRGIYHYYNGTVLLIR